MDGKRALAQLENNRQHHGAERPMRRMMRAYISGPITGVNGYKKRFAEAEKALIAAGFEVINPAKLPQRDDWTWADYMRACLPIMDSADMVVLLPGWMYSMGAKTERLYALGSGKKIFTLAEALGKGER
jgi:nucleoside 2-deoxyribosyltransferase